MGIVHLGGSASYAGKVGLDEQGDFFLKDMRELGILIEVPQTEGATGTCVVLITPDAQRTMLTHLGLSACLSEADIDVDHLKNAKYLYVEGYLFTQETTKQAAMKAISLAKEQGVKVAFTVSDPFLIEHHRDEFWQLIEGPVDLLFCNLEESRSLTQHHDPVDAAYEIHQHAENVALTLGPNGSLLMHEGELIPIEGVETKAIDTTGAGDIYASGILYGITNGLSWKEAGHLASHIAGKIVSQMGARLKEKLTTEELQRLRS